MGFLRQWNNPHSKPMVLPTRFFVWFHTPACEKSFFYRIFMQQAWVYQYMKFDQIPDHPNVHTSTKEKSHRGFEDIPIVLDPQLRSSTVQTKLILHLYAFVHRNSHGKFSHETFLKMVIWNDMKWWFSLLAQFINRIKFFFKQMQTSVLNEKKKFWGNHALRRPRGTKRKKFDSKRKRI